MNLPIIDNIPSKSKVVLRIDADLPMKDGVILDNYRLIKSISTIEELLKKECKIAIIGHMGRPQGEIIKGLSLKPVYIELMTLLEKIEGAENHLFLNNFDNKELIKKEFIENNIIFFENLRFWKGEEENNNDFLKNLIEISDVFVNDAFAVAHRKSASVMLGKVLPTFYGKSFVEEANKISRVVNNPERPMTIILGGAKEDKLKCLTELTEIADYILIGGKLPQLIKPSVSDHIGATSSAYGDLRLDRAANIILAELRTDGLDLSESDIKKFSEIIEQSKTVIWAGAMGFYEDKNSQKGTEKIASAVAECKGYKIIAGGDTSASIKNLGLTDKIDFVCSGAGVMLEYLVKETLPAFEYKTHPLR